MGRWLESGVRRDSCVLLYGTDGLSGQALKTRLERHYDERLEPRGFYGRLDALVDRGYVETRTEGLQDIYELTAAGERGVEEQFAWMRERIEGSD